ncbi:MAG: hypothetical protein A2527_04600 [Candidatus Lambdaproteobacteria bacterium RIFOXYD2_FULL_50_16]|uniref:Magnesium and cobalt efflux protein CorC n=1 Tax=Candidatus Lambdaproteobacteria bacterium RIFOXYD2_FULL_50_16 TaxID=1817772 RepID=A0A1F6GDK3_9PROT|nr:MAG: hypothetical protein A2527_04600 [Candidatus Lambdaproteobacteria bacterium RIFOXYD2_FULL_50_16]
MIPGIVALIVLIALSAFFSGIESAFISLSDLDQVEIFKSRAKNRKLLKRLLENREKLLSTVLVGNNLVNIGASALATTLAIDAAPSLDISKSSAATLSAVFLTLMILVFGEVTPKTVAMTHNRSIALFVAPIVYFLAQVLSPLTLLLSLASTYMGKAFGASKQNGITESTLINMVERGQELGVINSRERQLIEKVFQFDDREVYPIVTPRNKVFALKDTHTLTQVQAQLLEQMFSRIPVYGDTFDHITGILNLKTALKELLDGNGERQLKDLSDQPSFLYETQSLTSVLERFQAERIHMSIVVDEFGGMVGVVTLEDILEELVGEIFDEKDLAMGLIRPMGEHKWLVPGRLDVVTLNREIPGEIPIEGDYESVQGLIMSTLDCLPETGDQVTVGHHKFTVMKMKKNEIVSIMLEYLPALHKTEEEQ